MPHLVFASVLAVLMAVAGPAGAPEPGDGGAVASAFRIAAAANRERRAARDGCPVPPAPPVPAVASNEASRPFPRLEAFASSLFQRPPPLPRL